MIENYYNEKKLFPVDLLDNNWPFSFNVAEGLVEYNADTHCSSLKSFLLDTAILEDSEEEADENCVEKGNLVDSKFSFKDGKVYYYYIPPGVEEWRADGKLTGTLYCMDNVSYDSLMCEAIQFFMKSHLEESQYKDDLLDMQISTAHFLWWPISKLLLYTRYSSFVKNLIEEKKCMEKFQLQLMFCSYKRVLEIEDGGDFDTFFLSEKIISPRNRLLNLLSFSTLSRNDRERLVDNFFKTNSFQEILSYYEKFLSDSGYL